MSNYSIAIRTLGKAGEKYQKLLNSISKSKNQPDKVIVVLPEGIELPKERLGNEEFVFSEKGMISQRLAALKYIYSKYVLFLDDDIEYDAEFVDKLLEPLESGEYDCSTGPLFSFFPASTAGKIVGTITSSVAVSFFSRGMYVKILRSGGWSYHTFDTTVKRFYPTESFAWTCFMIKTDTMKNIAMDEERIWLEKYGYAAGDDKVMAYKLVKRGYKACIVSNALYTHNDARTSTDNTEMINTKPCFCTTYMMVVFWHRFIQDLERNPIRRLQNVTCYKYCKLMEYIYQYIKCTLKKQPQKWKAIRDGYRAGNEYVKSQEYRNLPPVK